MVVRWRLVDQLTGVLASGCDIDEGASDPHATRVHVHEMKLVVTPASGGVEPSCPSCRFPCDRGEWTTEFSIPEGPYRLSLQALACGTPIGESPPPVQRDIRRGEIANFGAIGILFPPCSRAPKVCLDGGTQILSGCP